MSGMARPTPKARRPLSADDADYADKSNFMKFIKGISSSLRHLRICFFNGSRSHMKSTDIMTLRMDMVRMEKIKSLLAQSRSSDAS